MLEVAEQRVPAVAAALRLRPDAEEGAGLERVPAGDGDSGVVMERAAHLHGEDDRSRRDRRRGPETRVPVDRLALPHPQEVEAGDVSDLHDEYGKEGYGAGSRRQRSPEPPRKHVSEVPRRQEAR